MALTLIQQASFKFKNGDAVANRTHTMPQAFTPGSNIFICISSSSQVSTSPWIQRTGNNASVVPIPLVGSTGGATVESVWALFNWQRPNGITDPYTQVYYNFSTTTSYAIHIFEFAGDGFQYELFGTATGTQTAQQPSGTPIYDHFSVVGLGWQGTATVTVNPQSPPWNNVASSPAMSGGSASTNFQGDAAWATGVGGSRNAQPLWTLSANPPSSASFTAQWVQVIPDPLPKSRVIRSYPVGMPNGFTVGGHSTTNVKPYTDPDGHRGSYDAEFHSGTRWRTAPAGLDGTVAGAEFDKMVNTSSTLDTHMKLDGSYYGGAFAVYSTFFEVELPPIKAPGPGKRIAGNDFKIGCRFRVDDTAQAITSQFRSIRLYLIRGAVDNTASFQYAEPGFQASFVTVWQQGSGLNSGQWYRTEGLLTQDQLTALGNDWTNLRLRVDVGNSAGGMTPSGYSIADCWLESVREEHVGWGVPLL
jgi:hypothetical protein